MGHKYSDFVFVFEFGHSIFAFVPTTAGFISDKPGAGNSINSTRLDFYSACDVIFTSSCRVKSVSSTMRLHAAVCLVPTPYKVPHPGNPLQNTL
jgi:hypothetical protein